MARQWICLIIVWICSISLAAQDHIRFKDPFTGTEQRWFRWGERLSSTASQKSGQLQLIHQASHTSWQFFHEIFLLNKANFRIETRVHLSADAADFSGGICWDLNPMQKSYYAFALRPGGYFRVIRQEKGTTTELIPWTRNRKIKISTEPLTIAVVKRASKIYMEVEGKEIAELKFSNFTGKYQGFYLEGRGKLTAEHFTVYHPPLDIHTVTGQLLQARKAPLDTTINQPDTHETTPMLSTHKRSLYFFRYHVGEAPATRKLWKTEVQGDSMWGAAQTMGSPTLQKMIPVLDETAILPSGVRFTLVASPTRPGNFSRSEDGKYLILSLKKESGYGDRDLYISFWENGRWTAPKNMGPDLNTFSREYTPYLAPDNKTLYFSSGGHPGYGQADLFVSERQSNTWTQWSQPKNLGPKVNGPGWDAWFFPVSQQHFYMASTDSIRGDFDLYGIRIPRDVQAQPRLRGVWPGLA